MEREGVKQAAQTNDSLERSLTHTRPEPKTHAPHSRPVTNQSGGGNGSPQKSSSSSKQ